MESQAYDYWVSPSEYTPAATPLGIPLDYSQYAAREGYQSSFDPAQPIYGVPQISPSIDGMTSFNYTIGMTPGDMSSADECSSQCSPRAPAVESAYHPPGEKSHTTSGRRRAQNRAAQRAFRERKEKHARDLENQLATLTEKYRALESDHTELSDAYERLRRTIDVLTNDEAEDHPPSNAERLRRLLGILHGEVKRSTPTRVEKEESD